MVFMGNGRAKESKDAIAGGLGHVALVAMHGLHHKLQGGIKEATSLFGVEVFDQFHRALDVGKESSDGLALSLGDAASLHRRLLGENALSKVVGSVADGRGGRLDSGLRT